MNNPSGWLEGFLVILPANLPCGAEPLLMTPRRDDHRARQRLQRGRAARRFFPLRGEVLESRKLLTLTPQLFADINLAPGAVEVRAPVVEVNGIVFFPGSAGGGNFADGDGEFQLWKSDGTQQGTSLVAENARNPIDLVNVGGTLFFRADDPVTGSELWKSDGTAAGTRLVKEIRPGPNGSLPGNLTNVNGTLFFRAFDGSNGSLWKSDGTESGTVVVKTVGASASSEYPWANVGGTLYFGGSDANGGELWKSDGSDAGTMMVKDINSGSLGSGPANFMDVGGSIFFTANDGTTGYELWKSDGTPEGTLLVEEIIPGANNKFSAPSNLVEMNGRLYFQANDGTNGSELWKSDGTELGTVMLKDIRQGTGGSVPQNLVNVSGTLFFAADDGMHSLSRQLWKSIGTEAGTVFVKDIFVGAQFAFGPRDLTNANGTLYFTAKSDLAQNQLWKSDGTGAGTFLIHSNPGTEEITGAHYRASAGNQFFFASADSTGHMILWKTNGSIEGTALVPRAGFATASSIEDAPMAAGDVGYFAATDGSGGMELWKADGTTGGTSLVSDLIPGIQGSYPRYLTDVSGTLFFGAGSSFYCCEPLWKSDGTAEGTELLNSSPITRSGSFTDFPGVLTSLNGELLYVAKNATYGAELWSSTGTSQGTALLKDINPGSDGSYPASIVNMNGALFFRANDGTNGNELWKSDGTSGGTVIVKDILGGAGDSYPRLLTIVNGSVFFMATEGTSGVGLWKTDGTPDGTILVADLPGSSDSCSCAMANVGDRLVFYYSNSAGRGLWVSDGTTEGTVLLKNLELEGSTFMVRTGVVAGTFFMGARSGGTGFELWKSNGTVEGTVLVKDIFSGSGSSYPADFYNLNGVLLFSAIDGTTGRELWRSDGTEAGTYRVSDIAALSRSSSPRSFVTWAGTTYFTADDLIHGRELWRLVDVNVAPRFVSGIDIDATDESGLKDVIGWAKDVYAGAPDEIEQAKTFTVTADHPELFLEQPEIDAVGNLSFRPKPNVSGTSSVTVMLRDDGGTANGGMDTSAPQSFTINIVKAHIWHNAANAADVTGPDGLPDGHVVAGDALEIINFLNAFGPQNVPTDGRTTGPYCDVNGDGSVAPGDALDVINHINGVGLGGEGEESRDQKSEVRSQEAAEWEELLAILAMDVARKAKRR